MAAPFSFDHRIEFFPADADQLLRAVPASSGVFSLRGADPAAEPYLTRAADLRRRMRRLLAPPEAVDEQGRPVLSKRLNLRERVRWIEWTRTGSEFESAVVLYSASRAVFGAEEARRRLRLHAPYMLRVTMSHRHPRVYATNRVSKRSLGESFGPFPSRAAAERYCDAVLDLFLLRRCHEDLEPCPEHPGCVYGEMKKCMEPCKEGNVEACTPEQYAQEARRVFAFFATRGQSLLDEVAARREAASEAMDFEGAAALHQKWERVRAAALLADEIVGPVAQVRALIVQEAAPAGTATGSDGSRTETAAVFLLQRGQIAGPEGLSTLGVRAVREQTAVGSSLFAQPLMLAAVPLGEVAGEGGGDEAAVPRSGVETVLAPEDRARKVIETLAARAASDAELAEFCDAMSLFRRWYYRPEKQREGEVFLPNPDGGWPVRRILNGAARVVLGPPGAVSAVDREAARARNAAVKTKMIHAGREGVEREVPVLPRRTRRRKAARPGDVAE